MGCLSVCLAEQQTGVDGGWDLFALHLCEGGGGGRGGAGGRGGLDGLDRLGRLEHLGRLLPCVWGGRLQRGWQELVPLDDLQRQLGVP